MAGVHRWYQGIDLRLPRNTCSSRACGGQGVVLNPFNSFRNSCGKRFSVFKVTTRWRQPVLFAVLASALALSGCASDSESRAEARVRDNGSCKETRRELDRLDSKGVPSLIDAATAGKKLSSSQRADVDRYNSLLQSYLGSRCHLM